MIVVYKFGEKMTIKDRQCESRMQIYQPDIRWIGPVLEEVEVQLQIKQLSSLSREVRHIRQKILSGVQFRT